MSKIDKSITPYNNKLQAHGYWETYSFGNLWYKGLFNNDKPLGYEELYYNSDGKLTSKKYNL